jgi:hypothetical protein
MDHEGIHGHGHAEGPEGRGKGKMGSREPWLVEIDVHLTKGCPNPEFKIHSTLPTKLKGKEELLVFDNNHRPGFNIRFNLIDETGEGYTFPPQRKIKDACWSKVGSECPASAVWQVLDPRNVSPDGLSLWVYNENPSPALGEFQYTLNVLKEGGDYCPLDPGGVDNNGQRAFA